MSAFLRSRQIPTHSDWSAHSQRNVSALSEDDSPSGSRSAKSTSQSEQRVNWGDIRCDIPGNTWAGGYHEELERAPPSFRVSGTLYLRIRSFSSTLTVSPTSFPIARRISSFTGSIWLPLPIAMNELLKG